MTISNGVYSENGIRTTTVSGSSWTGLYAADGSYNIVLDSSGNGLYHPCGAWRVSSASNPNNLTYDPSGAYYLSTLLGKAGLPYSTGITRANTGNVRAAWAAQSGNVQIATIGDSTMAGVTTGAGTTQAVNSWPAKLATLLQASGTNSGQNNRFGVASGTFAFLTGFDSRVSASGGWSQNATLAVGGNAFGATATGALNFTPQGNVTKFVIKWRDGASGRNFNWQVDAGSTTQVNSTGTIQVGSSGPLTAGASGSHTLTINWVLGSVTILGIDAYDDTAGRIEVSIWNWGISGANSANLIDNTDPQAGRFVEYGVFAPKLSLIEGGAINDWQQSVAVATFQANLTTLVQKMLTVGDVIICTPPFDPVSTGNTANQQLYVDAMYTVAAANNCGVFDIRQKWRSYANAVANGWQVAGSTDPHPTQAGYADMAQAILPVIKFALAA